MVWSWICLHFFVFNIHSYLNHIFNDSEKGKFFFFLFILQLFCLEKKTHVCLFLRFLLSFASRPSLCSAFVLIFLFKLKVTLMYMLSRFCCIILYYFHYIMLFILKMWHDDIKYQNHLKNLEPNASLLFCFMLHSNFSPNLRLMNKVSVCRCVFWGSYCDSLVRFECDLQFGNIFLFSCKKIMSWVQPICERVCWFVSLLFILQFVMGCIEFSNDIIVVLRVVRL